MSHSGGKKKLYFVEPCYCFVLIMKKRAYTWSLF